MTDYREFKSLANAFTVFEIPVANHALIKQLCEFIGIDRYEIRRTYIKAVRTDGRPALNIHYGWTNGFQSEAEARAAAGVNTPCFPSERGTGQWWVRHPLHDIEP